MAASCAAYGFGQGTTLYAPVRSIKDQGISVRGWGSGTISETDEMAYEGTYSIRVSTRNFFQGGILSLTNPVDLSQAFADKNNLLRILVRVADQSQTLGGGGGGGRRGGPGAATGGAGVGGGPSGAGFGPGFAGGGGRGQGGGDRRSRVRASTTR